MLKYISVEYLLVLFQKVQRYMRSADFDRQIVLGAGHLFGELLLQLRNDENTSCHKPLSARASWLHDHLLAYIFV